MPVSWPSPHSGVSPYRPTAYTSFSSVCICVNVVSAETFPRYPPSPAQYAQGQARRNGSHAYSATCPSSQLTSKTRRSGRIRQPLGRWNTSATSLMIRTMATMEDFERIEMRVGRIVAVEDFPAARNPSYKLTIDFGPFGTRRSSVAVRPWYAKDQLEGRLVVCVTNFPPRRIATFDSEVLTLGAIDAAKRVTLLEPDAECELGSRIG